ncbi:hypothetical protein H2O64_04085 [Kordia sp. YSTF-M3]|uniref:Uncharacterized protein n=1 Tax=Kordia aestuariivivens TaxID=2759037 RepID=A0ABR7Q5J9_9FLAO|nr:hypothetical protein [Kordia aestuariivivens]MBC8753835.1 hypothetical protein [Kordia aestuariivivens]
MCTKFWIDRFLEYTNYFRANNSHTKEVFFINFNNYMKRRNRIIVAIIFLVTFFLCDFYLLPDESEHYLKSDIINLEQSLLPISIILSIIIAFFTTFDKSEFGNSIRAKIGSIVYVGVMSYLFFGLTSSLVTTVALKTNRITETETLTKNFVITNNIFKYNNRIDTIPSINHFENKHNVRGRISGKVYKDGVDGIFMNTDDYTIIQGEKEFEITLKTGFFGIPYDPKIVAIHKKNQL